MASTSVTFVLTGPISLSVACPVPVSLTSPLGAGAVLAPITVQPVGWSGALTLTGPDAGLFAISSGGGVQNFTVGASPLTVPRAYNFTVVATP